MREKTIIYFYSGVSEGKTYGDCMLLENIDSNGVIRHALLDSGFQQVIKFLKKHNVKKLEFICVTHSHLDHNGTAGTALKEFPVDLLIMKEYDDRWSDNGNQVSYENILKVAISKNVKVLGTSYLSLISDEYSPSRSDSFKEAVKNAKEENFIFFNENNISFQFGSAKIKLMNWEIFDIEGDLFVPGQNKAVRYRSTTENQNSLGLLLFQGNKKAFFAGDMNDHKKIVGGIRIGDESRLKNEIGKIDFLKLGHHGHRYSNTTEYLNVISPEYGVITNTIGDVYLLTLYNLEVKKINYMYAALDEYEINATIYNDEVNIGFGTSGLKKFKNEVFYIPENRIYSNYLKYKCKVEYDYIEKTVNNWDELKTTIEQHNISKGIYINDKCYVIEGLIITLNAQNNNNIYTANSTILINQFKNIKIITNKNEIIIKRDTTLIESPLFKIDGGVLYLGEENMKGKIIVDGNKDNVTANSQLITVRNGELSIYENICLCNNYYQISYEPTKSLDYGSAVCVYVYSKFNMYGGEISNNILEMLIDKNMSSSILPECMYQNKELNVKGTIFLSNSIFNMYRGKICRNQCINNSDIYSNQNSTYGLNSQLFEVCQRCVGAAICADYNVKLNLYKGEISDNIAINNAKINLITPLDEKKTKIKTINQTIFGSALFADHSFIEIADGFLIENNSAKLNPTINISANCNVNDINNLIEGGQIYMAASEIHINGVIVNNSNNSYSAISNISPDENGKIKTISSHIYGGGVKIQDSQNFNINNLKIMKCNSYYGGGIYITTSVGKISNSEFSYNISTIFGGGIYMSKTCNLSFYNIKILNNSAGESGGGINSEGEFTIDGENSSISNNEAGTYGGGMTAKAKTTINNCIICNNKALKNCGGGIRMNAELILNNAQIYKNWCKERGGGINLEKCNSFNYDKNIIKSIVYNNKADLKGNDFYPELK